MPRFEGYHIVPASIWVTLHPEKQKLLRDAGGFPVNDTFIPLWERADTQRRESVILYGTYGSSKTTDRVAEHILCCLTDPYFKCFYGRDIFDLAKKEFHSIIVSTIIDMGFEDRFEFSRKPNGSKEISCPETGGVFKPFGCDDVSSLKGWDNATHVLVDEMNEISFAAYGMLVTRLRKQGAKKCFTGMFNNCDVFEDHWIRTTLLNKEAPLTDEKGKPIERNIIEHFSIYTDNYFIDHEDYKNGLIEQAGQDLERRNAYLTGAWGVKTNGQPFYKDFSPSRNTSRKEYDPSLALHISFDENSNPYLPCGVFQVRGLDAWCIDEIAAKSPHNKIRWVCEEIYRRYGPDGLNHTAGMLVYGDATSRKESTQLEEGKNLFTLAIGYLKHFKPRLRVNKSNPSVSMRGNFINDIFSKNLYGINATVDPRCTNMVADLIHTTEAPDGNGKDKTKTKVDGISLQRWGHFSDLFDYFICAVFAAEYARFQTAGVGSKWRTAKRRPHNVY